MDWLEGLVKTDMMLYISWAYKYVRSPVSLLCVRLMRSACSSGVGSGEWDRFLFTPVGRCRASLYRDVEGDIGHFRSRVDPGSRFLQLQRHRPGAGRTEAPAHDSGRGGRRGGQIDQRKSQSVVHTKGLLCFPILSACLC